MEENEVLENEIIEEEKAPEVIEEHAPNSSIITAINNSMVHRVYIQVDGSGNVTDINSDSFIRNFAGWILVDVGIGDKYAHAQHNYLDLPLISDGVYNYRYLNGKINLL